MLYLEALSFSLLRGSRATALLTLDISYTLQEGLALQLYRMRQLNPENSKKYFDTLQSEEKSSKN